MGNCINMVKEKMKGRMYFINYFWEEVMTFKRFCGRGAKEEKMHNMYF